MLDWYHRVEGRDLPEELSIPLGRGPGPVDDDHVGIMGHHFCYCTRLCPLTSFVRDRLVLDSHRVTNSERREDFRTKTEPLLHSCVSLGKCFLPNVSLNSPLPPGLILREDGRQVVTLG